MNRTILHCDCNAYYASVEMLFRPELANVPMAVCGDPKSRQGIILAKNELAKSYGIVTAQTVWQAKQKCKDLVLVPPRREEYGKFCVLINEIYKSYTDRVEMFSIDESWLDVSASLRLFGDGKQIADTIRKRVEEEIGITISVGVSFNKIFAKLGSDYKKPNATTVITQENYKEILYPLPVTDMFFVGKRTAERLQKMGITTIGALANTQKNLLKNTFGKAGEMLHDYANGIDNTPVRSADDVSERKSIGNGITFKRNLLGEEDIKRGLQLLVDNVGTRLRAKGLFCKTVQVHIKDPNFNVISRQATLPRPICTTKALYDAAYAILQKEWNFKRPIRLLSLNATNLCNNNIGQLTFFDEPEQKTTDQESLDSALDSIRKKYGKKSVLSASLLDTDIVSSHDYAEDGSEE